MGLGGVDRCLFGQAAHERQAEIAEALKPFRERALQLMAAMGVGGLVVGRVACLLPRIADYVVKLPARVPVP